MNSMEKDINNLIEELTNVRPNELSTEGLKLFNKINEIIDKNKELEEENRIFALEGSRVSLKVHIDKNYIPVSLVEETIEELKENGYWNYLEERDLETTIEILEKLLEKRK